VGTDRKALLRINEPAANGLAQEHSVTARVGSWLTVDSLQGARALAQRFKTAWAGFMIETVSETLMLGGGVGRRETRYLEHTCDERGRSRWRALGRPLPFEDARAVTRWRQRKRFSVNSDGYELLSAFLGGPLDEGSEITTERKVAPPAPMRRFEPADEERSPAEQLRDAFYERRWSSLAKLARAPKARAEAGELLYVAAQDGDARAMKLLLAAKADPNTRGSGGQTALHITYPPALVAALVKAGADVDARDDRGLTPLLAEMSNLNPRSASYVRALLAAGANPDARAPDGRSPEGLLRRYVQRRKAAEQWAPAVERLIARARARV
jgi:hypothetical protein